MTDLVPSYVTLSEMQAIEMQAKVLASSGFVPKNYQNKPGDIMAAALYGREVGWNPVTALQHIAVINGKPTMGAEAMAALIRQHGHSIKVDVWTDKLCKITGTRKDNGDTLTVEFSIEDAKKAGLLSNSVWTKYPKSMLWARALTQMGRSLFADVIMGISYTPEEMGAVVDAEIVRDVEPVSPAEIAKSTPTPKSVAQEDIKGAKDSYSKAQEAVNTETGEVTEAKGRVNKETHADLNDDAAAAVDAEPDPEPVMTVEELDATRAVLQEQIAGLPDQHIAGVKVWLKSEKIVWKAMTGEQALAVAEYVATLMDDLSVAAK